MSHSGRPSAALTTPQANSISSGNRHERSKQTSFSSEHRAPGRFVPREHPALRSTLGLPKLHPTSFEVGYPASLEVVSPEHSARSVDHRSRPVSPELLYSRVVAASPSPSMGTGVAGRTPSGVKISPVSSPERNVKFSLIDVSDEELVTWTQVDSKTARTHRENASSCLNNNVINSVHSAEATVSATRKDQEMNPDEYRRIALEYWRMAEHLSQAQSELSGISNAEPLTTKVSDDEFNEKSSFNSVKLPKTSAKRHSSGHSSGKKDENLVAKNRDKKESSHEIGLSKKDIERLRVRR
ncbi:hypothetical protein R3P38DRAFT_3624460 [Favolaschia claudopus]|uniref:Uncharacterized protein n=1 Tax=Favolaschia claudopus TaxID=2862362 RepID=A0AAW0A2S5_9AGAR